MMIMSERGFILPAILGIVLIVATLLLMVASQIEVKSSSYERTQNFWRLISLEREGLAQLENRLLNRTLNEESGNFSEMISLRDGGVMNVEVSFFNENLEIAYYVRYNGFMRTGRVNYVMGHGFVFINH